METKNNFSFYYELSNHVRIPSLAYGTWKLENNVAETVGTAIDTGYRSIDTAYSYGNDFYVGKAIKKSGFSREELFITNKVWNSFRGKESTVEAFKKSLRLMKLNYFDLYLIHWPAPITQENWAEINLSTWEGMEELYKEGLVRSVGVSNFKIHHLKKLLDGNISVKPMVNQIELHPGYYQKDLVDFCKENNILVEGWSPFGSGQVLSNSILVNLSQKYKCTPAQLCLNWAADKKIIPVARTQNAERMKENLFFPEINLSEEDTLCIDSLSDVGFSGFDADLSVPE